MFNKKQRKIEELEQQVKYLEESNNIKANSIKELHAANQTLIERAKKKKSLEALQKEVQIAVDELNRDVHQAMTCKALEIVRNGANAKTVGELNELTRRQIEAQKFANRAILLNILNVMHPQI